MDKDKKDNWSESQKQYPHSCPISILKLKIPKNWGRKLHLDSQSPQVTLQEEMVNTCVLVFIWIFRGIYFLDFSFPPS